MLFLFLIYPDVTQPELRPIVQCGLECSRCFVDVSGRFLDFNFNFRRPETACPSFDGVFDINFLGVAFDFTGNEQLPLALGDRHLLSKTPYIWSFTPHKNHLSRFQFIGQVVGVLV